jgi:hypothetical protein
MHDDSARPLWGSWERAAAVSHTLMVSSEPDDKMTKSEGTSLGAAFWASTIRGSVLVLAGRVNKGGTLRAGEPRTVLV